MAKVKAKGAAKVKRKYSTPAWQRKEGKNPTGGLNEKGRASAQKQGQNIKRPQPEGGKRKRSVLCAHERYAWADEKFPKAAKS